MESTDLEQQSAEGSELEDLGSVDEGALESPDLDGEVEGEPLPLVAQISSLLFVSSRPVSLETLSELTRATTDDVDAALQELRSQLEDEKLGFVVEDIGGSYQFRTTPRSAKIIHRLIPAKARRLSRAAAETLAIVAYKQPVQRAEIEAIRGVDALPTLRTLLDAKLIRIVGREASPGQPALYGTTSMFLEKFGLRDLSELPTVRELIELSQEPGEPRQIEPEFSEDEPSPSGE